MATHTYHLQLVIAWWLWPYLHLLAFVSAVSGREVDWDKFDRAVCRAVTFKPVPERDA